MPPSKSKSEEESEEKKGLNNTRRVISQNEASPRTSQIMFKKIMTSVLTKTKRENSERFWADADHRSFQISLSRRKKKENAFGKRKGLNVLEGYGRVDLALACATIICSWSNEICMNKSIKIVPSAQPFVPCRLVALFICRKSARS